MPKHNPNWGKPGCSSAPTPTEFEKLVLELNLQPDQYATSEPLHNGVAAHHNTRYVPEPLLETWGFVIDTNG